MRRDRFIIDAYKYRRKFILAFLNGEATGVAQTEEKLPEKDSSQTAPRYERGQNFEFFKEEGLCLARVHRRNFMKDDNTLSFEVEFIRQISFLP